MSFIPAILPYITAASAAAGAGVSIYAAGQKPSTPRPQAPAPKIGDLGEDMSKFGKKRSGRAKTILAGGDLEGLSTGRSQLLGGGQIA